MKTTFLAIATAVTSAGLIAVINLWLSRAQPHVKYTLSEQIPSLAANGAQGSELVQYLEVKNVGNATAESIRVRLKGRVAATKIEPYAQTDRVQTFPSPDGYELVYPRLPPDGSFRLIFAAAEGGVPQDRISVQHSRGSAEPALAPRTGDTGLATFELVSGLFFLVFTLTNFRSFLEQQYEQKFKLEPADAIVARSKPFYFSQQKWTGLIKTALGAIASTSSFWLPFSKQRAYEFLGIQKSDYLTEGEWRGLVERAESTLKDWVIYRTVGLSDPDFKALLAVTRPQYISNEGWAAIEEEISNAFAIRTQRELVFQIEDALARYNVSRPPVVTDGDWKAYRRFWLERVEALVVERVINGEHYTRFTELKIDDLPADRRDRLRRIAYQASYLRLNWNINVEGAADSLRELNKYDWLTRDDLQEWRQHLEDIVNMRRQSECLSIAMRLFQDAVDGTLEEEQIISVDLKFAESLRKLNCRAKELVDLKNALLNERTILSVARMKVAVEARGLRVRKAMDSG